MSFKQNPKHLKGKNPCLFPFSLVSLWHQPWSCSLLGRDCCSLSLSAAVVAPWRVAAPAFFYWKSQHRHSLRPTRILQTNLATLRRKSTRWSAPVQGQMMYKIVDPSEMLIHCFVLQGDSALASSKTPYQYRSSLCENITDKIVCKVMCTKKMTAECSLFTEQTLYSLHQRHQNFHHALCIRWIASVKQNKSHEGTNNAHSLSKQRK